jgi:hypothetical protein
MSSRKDLIEKERNAILSKDIATKNPIFEATQIGELFNMFSLYADPRNRKSDVRDVLITAKTLGLDTKYQLVFRALEEIADARKGDPIDFETFLRDLTAKLVASLILFRDHLTLRRAATPPLTFWTSTERASSIWTPCCTSTINLNTVSRMLPLRKSSRTSVDRPLTLSPTTAGTSISRDVSTRPDSTPHDVWARRYPYLSHAYQ